MRLVEDISFAAEAVTCSGGHVEAVFISTFELIRGHSHVVKVTQRSKTTGNITISCSTTLCGFFCVINSMEAQFVTLEVNMRF